MKNDQSIIQEKPKKKNKFQMKMIVFLVVVLAILIIIPYYFIASGLREEEFILRSFQYAEVDTRTFVRNMTSSGVVRPGEIINIHSQLKGEISSIIVKPGEEVEKNQILLTIAAPELKTEISDMYEEINEMSDKLEEMKQQRQLQLRQNEFTLINLKRELAETETELEIDRELYQLGTISKKELENKEREVESKALNLENTKFEIEVAEKKADREIADQKQLITDTRGEIIELETKLESLAVKAPISGRIMNVEVEENSRIAADSLLLQVADMENARLELNLSETEVDNIFEGKPGQITAGGRSIPGYVSYISPVIESGADIGGVDVYVSLEEIPENLRINATGTVNFETDRRDNIPYLPRGNYLVSGEHSFVYLILEGKAVRTDVIFGQYDGNFVEIRSGLEPGDEIITSSYEDFKERREINLIREGGRKIN